MSATVATGADTGVTFALEDEDHTLANSLRFLLNKKCAQLQVSKSPWIKFAHLR